MTPEEHRTIGRNVDPVIAAQAAVDSVVLAGDEFAQTAADVFWEFSRAEHCAVSERLRRIGDPDIAARLRAVDAGTATRADIHDFAALLATRFATGGSPWRELAVEAMSADANSRLSIHAGGNLPRCAPVTAEDLGPRGLPPPSRASDAPVLVVIPFRDSDPARPRLRNLLACLTALADQSVPRDNYRCVVVELDSEPRHREAIVPYVDRYLFARSARRFNKSWAVNIGVVAEADAATVLCILDGDILVDRDFVRRNVARFERRGAHAHWPYTDALCLDPTSTDYAIRRRCSDEHGAMDLSDLHGVFLRRPPGHCVWLRQPLFMRVRGMDERFEGWGGEDLDFIFRVEFMGSLDRFDDPLVHMFHPRPQVREDGEWLFAKRRFLSWQPIDRIGRLDGPARSRDDEHVPPQGTAATGATPDAILS